MKCKHMIVLAISLVILLFPLIAFGGGNVISGDEGEMISDIQPASSPDKTRLMNFKDWFRASNGNELLETYESMGVIQLDKLFQVDSLDIESKNLYGLTNEAVEYPSEWPSRWLNGIIPEYTGTGWMFDLYITRPPMSYDARDIERVMVTVYDYLPEELDAYIVGLLSNGFEETPVEQSYPEWVEQVQSFRRGDCTLGVLRAQGLGGTLSIEGTTITDNPDDAMDFIFNLPNAPFSEMPDGFDKLPDNLDDFYTEYFTESPSPFVQFNVEFSPDPYILDTSPTAGTELLNIEQWASLTGQFTEEECPKMDQSETCQDDENGTLYNSIRFPSQWPKGIFGNLIPEFVYPGLLYSMNVLTPANNPLPDQVLLGYLILVDVDPKYADEYARKLSAFGCREVLPEEYNSTENSLLETSETFHVFTLPSIRVILSTSGSDGPRQMNILVNFPWRSNNFL